MPIDAPSTDGELYAAAAFPISEVVPKSGEATTLFGTEGKAIGEPEAGVVSGAAGVGSANSASSALEGKGCHSSATTG